MLGNKPFGVALTASVSELLAVRCVEAVERTLAESLAGEGLDLLPVVVAGFAEVVRAEAEPPGSLAAVAAFVHYVVGAVLCAVGHADLDAVLLAEAAHVVLGLSLVDMLLDFLLLFLFSLLDACRAVSHATVVRELALVALVVLKLEQCELLKLVVELLAFLSDTFALVETFDDRLVFDSLLDHAIHAGALLDDVVSGSWQVLLLSHLFIAGWAVDEIAVDRFACIPLALHLRVETVCVENVLARQLDAGTVSKRVGIAKGAVRVKIHSQSFV